MTTTQLPGATMQGFVIAEKDKAEWRTLPVPAVNPYGALVRTVVVSPCTTDVHLLQTGSASIPWLVGKPIGHEMVGIVEQVGELVREFKPGDRVVVSACQPDFRSLEAQAGQPKLHNTSQYWVDDPDRGGSVVDYYYLLDADMNLAHIPDSVTDEQALMIPDMAATAFEGVRELGIGYGDTVAVLGVGPVGLMGVRAAVLHGAGRVFAIGSRPVSFQVATAYGATDTIDYHKGDFVAEILERNGGPVDAVLVAGGTTASITDALRLVRRGGTVANVAAFFADETTVLDNVAWGYGYGEKTIKAVECSGGRWFLEKLLALVEHGRLDPAPLITHRFHGKDHTAEALQLFLDHDRTLLKPAVYFD